jgi:MSHA biogenesis protein MshG
MTEFHYRARNSSGQLVTGKLEGASSESIASQLQKEGLLPINIDASPSKRFSFRRLNFRLGQKKISLDEMLIFCRQMHTLTKAGIPIVSAIAQLAEISRNPDFADALHGVADSVAGGQELTGALMRFPKIFQPLVIRLVQVGEETGRLDQAFLQISDYLSLEDVTIKRIKTVFRYPMIVIIAIAAAIVVINVLVIPSFAQLFASFQTELPLPTRILLSFSNFMLNNWIVLAGGLLLALLALRYSLKTTQGRLRWDYIMLHVPLIGPIINRIVLARFARTFVVMVRSGLPILQSLELVASSVGNAYAQERILSMSQMIGRGESLTRAAANANLFSPLVIQMINVGEETGNLDQILQETADFYEREVDYDLKRLATLIEPVLIVLIGALVLMLALAVFLPMWDIVKFARTGA